MLPIKKSKKINKFEGLDELSPKYNKCDDNSDTCFK